MSLPPPSFVAQISEMGKSMLVAGLALLVACAVLLFSAQRDLRDSNAAVQRDNAALLALADIRFLVIGVDYSARGYSLTGEQLFINHESEKQRDLRLRLADLSRLTGPAFAEQVRRLSRLAERHAAVYADFVKQGPKRTAAMAALITDPVERQKRYDVLAVVDSLHVGLMADLVQRHADAERQNRYTAILMFVIVATAFLGGVMEMLVRRFGRRRTGLGGHRAAV
jgi:CHASE3 domain sensor protein